MTGPFARVDVLPWWRSESRSITAVKTRAQTFRYLGLDVAETSLTGHFDLDGRQFHETVVFENVGDLRAPATASVAQLWYLLAGLSYYKAGAAHEVDLGNTPVGEKGLQFFSNALHDGLGEFSYRNELPLDDVVIHGGAPVEQLLPYLDQQRVLIPFGGGIDSVVSVAHVAPQVSAALFVVSPASGRFAPLEETAHVTGLDVVRATRHLDPQILKGDPSFFNGHVPVTAMVSMLAVIASISSGRGGVVMSNEHSSSAPNVVWNDQAINHQWSKSFQAEVLLAEAVEERIGSDFTIASFLRNRSELWVAQEFAKLTSYLPVFRSCNRAFAQDANNRASTWCGECDKCLFIHLILAPFVSRNELREIFHAEPVANPALLASLEAMVGIGLQFKPFECVGDPDECAIALQQLVTLPEWQHETALRELSMKVSPDRSFEELLQSQGASRVPTHWIR